MPIMDRMSTPIVSYVTGGQRTAMQNIETSEKWQRRVRLVRWGSSVLYFTWTQSLWAPLIFLGRNEFAFRLQTNIYLWQCLLKGSRNRPLAWWRQFTAKTRMLLVASTGRLIFEIGQTVDSCVSQKRENLRFSTCLTILRSYSIYMFSLGTILSPKRNWKQCLCKIWGDKQRVLWYFPKWPVVSVFSRERSNLNKKAFW